QVSEETVFLASRPRARYPVSVVPLTSHGHVGRRFPMYDFSYCLNTSTIQPTPLLEKIRIAGRLGYDAIELWNDEITEFEEHSSLGELKRIITDAGLRVASVIALGNWLTSEGETYRRALDECRRRMDQAAAVGSPVIVAS